MPRALKVCPTPGCPELVTSGRCAQHRREAEQARGTKQARGYDREHDRLRRRWAPKVARGTVACARCKQLIRAEQAWDLGHTDDRTRWTGPEHATCNRSAGGSG